MTGKGYEVVKLVIRPRCGMSISWMAKTALKLAVDRMQDVEFLFNDMSFTISPDTIIRDILERYDAPRGPSVEPGSHT